MKWQGSGPSLLSEYRVFQKSLPVSILKSQGNVSLKNTEDAISCAFLFFTNRIVNKIECLSTIYYLKIEKSAEFE